MKTSLLAIGLILAAGCSPAPTSKAPATAPAAAPPSAAKEFRPPAKSFLSYKTPPEWISEEVTENMRKAQYRIPDKGGKAAAASLTFFKLNAQNVETIVNYWRDKMGGADANVAPIKGAACPTTLVDIAGEYTGDSPAIPDARFLGAIVETGDQHWYLKFVGPAATVEGWRDAYVEMLKGLKPTEQ